MATAARALSETVRVLLLESCFFFSLPLTRGGRNGVPVGIPDRVPTLRARHRKYPRRLYRTGGRGALILAPA